MNNLLFCLNATVPLYNVMAVIILSFTSPDNQEKNKIRKIKQSMLEIVQNPMIIGIAIGMMFSFSRVPIPSIMDKTLRNLGGSCYTTCLNWSGSRI